LARRYKSAFSVVIFDIDYFKRVNDSYGHLTGDNVLKTIALRLNDMVREADIPARFGGEEFIFLLSETDLSGAAKVAEKIREEISCLNFSDGGGKTFRITASFGISSYMDETGQRIKIEF